MFIGDDSLLAEYVARAGASQIVGVSPWPPKTPWRGPHGARTNMVHHVMALEQLRFSNGSFDLVVVPTLAITDNPGLLISELRRVLVPGGGAVVATPNPDASIFVDRKGMVRSPDYYQFYHLMAQFFASVQMVGQSPFGGFSVSDLSCEDSEIEVTFNAELVDPEGVEFEWFMAICGDVPVALDPLSVIQVPPQPATDGASADQVEHLLAELETIQSDKIALERAMASAKLELGNRGVRIESLEKKIEEELLQSEEARARAVSLAKELDNERKASTKKHLEEEFQKRSAEIDIQAELREAKKQLRLAEERANSAEAARDELIETMRSDAQELDRLRDRQATLEEKLQKMRNRDAELHQKEDALLTRLKEAEQKLAKAASAAAENEKKLAESVKAREAAEKAAKDAAEKAAKEVDAARRAAEADAAAVAASVEAKDVDEEPQVPASELALLSEENAAFEARLQETAQRKKEAEDEVERQKAIIRDLVVQLGARGDAAKGIESSSEVSDERIAVLEVEIAGLRGARAGQYRARVEAELELASLAATVERQRGEAVAASILLQEKDAEIALLKKKVGQAAPDDLRLAELTGELQSCRWRVDELEARNADLSSRLEASDSQASVLQNELREAQATLTSGMERAEQDAADAIKAQADHLREMDRVRLETEETARVLRERLAEQERVVEEKEKALFAVDEENRKLKAAMEALERNERRLDEETAHQAERAKRLRKDLDDEKERTRSLLVDVERIRGDRDRMERDLGELTRRLGEMSEEHRRVVARAEEAEERVREAECRLSAQQIEVNAAQIKIDELSRTAASSRDALDEQLHDALERLDGEKGKVSELQEKLDAVENRLAEEVSRGDGLRAAVEMVKAELAAELNLTRMAGADAARISGDAIALKKQLATAHRELDEKEQALETTVRVLGSLRNEVAALNARLRDGVLDDNGENDELTEEMGLGLKALEQENAGLAQELESTRAALDETKEQVLQAFQRLKEGEAEIAEAQQSVVEMEAKIIAINQSKVGMSVELADAIQHAERLESELEGIKKGDAERSSELDTLVARLEVAEAAASEVPLLRRQLEEANASALDKVSATEKRLAEAETVAAKVPDLEAQLADAEAKMAEIPALQKRIADFEEGSKPSEVLRLKNRLAEVESEAKKWRQDLDDANEKMADMEKVKALVAEKEALVSSLTEQLEERERRASKLEKKNRMLADQIREHESDVVAWNAELKVRTARIAQLEKQLEEAQGR